jgi:hypothetical protein
MTTELNEIVKELRKANSMPLSVMVDANVTYVIYGAITIGKATGYPILRTTDATVNHSYFDNGFLLETDRVVGANGSAANANIKTDYADSILLLTNPLLTYA